MTTYNDSGVSIDAAQSLVKKIRKTVRKNPIALKSIGKFAALYPLSNIPQASHLTASADGVGTKLKIAFLLNKHNTIGIDLVAMNVNDLLCEKSLPIFFLNYFSCGKLDVPIAESVIKGIQKGCLKADCMLIGGETAEMPGFLKVGEYDLAGFAVGYTQKNHSKSKAIKEGDVVVGFPSSGIHSNGYSLVRHIFSDEELIESGKEFLKPTRIYTHLLKKLIDDNTLHLVKAIAHITGGGWLKNPIRMLPKNYSIKFIKDSWPQLDIFKSIQEKGNISNMEMFKTFNMGIGLMLVVDKKNLSAIRRLSVKNYVIGHVFKGDFRVQFVEKDNLCINE